MAHDLDPTNLIVRHPDRLGTGPLLVVDPPGSGAVNRLGRLPGVGPISVWARDWRLVSGIKSTAHQFALAPESFEPMPNGCLIYLPKGKASLRLTLAVLAAKLPSLERTVVAGSIRRGIKSSERTVAEYFTNIRRVASGNHCVMIAASAPQEKLAPLDIAVWRRTFTATSGNKELELVTYPGVFSEDGLDPGTAMLLDTLDDRPRRRVLDLGSGNGVLGTAAALRWPDAEVELVDVGAAALAATAETISLNRIPNARCYASDLYSEVDGRFDLILCNPPFHTGVDTDQETVRRIIAGAAERLNDGGRLQLVANRHLPYARLMERYFADIDVVREDNRYVVYSGERPRLRR